MEQAGTADLGFGVVCIDAQYIRPGLACFYLVERDGECAVIETGTVHSVPALEAVLASRGIAPEQVRYVIPTHVHLDHAGGAGLMMEHFPDARLLVHPRGARHLVDPQRLIAASQHVYGESQFLQLYGEIVPAPADRVVEVEDGAMFPLGRGTLLFRHTPGHAEHHFCVWDERSLGWFSGDVFGISYGELRTPGGDYVMPSTTPSQFRPEALARSLDVLASMQPERIFLTHYGELRYSGKLRQMLLDQIDAYQAMTREQAGDAGALESLIVEHSLEQLSELDPGLDMAHLRATLHNDAHLNAQGLATWYQKENQ